MGFLSGMGAPLPKMLHLTAEFVLNTSLRQEFMADELDLERVRDSARHRRPRKNPMGRQHGSAMPSPSASAAWPTSWPLKPQEGLLHRFNLAVDLVRSLPFEVDLRRVQNVYYQLLQHVYPVVAREADEASRLWIGEFTALGHKLGVCVEPPASPA